MKNTGDSERNIRNFRGFPNLVLEGSYFRFSSMTIISSFASLVLYLVFYFVLFYACLLSDQGMGHEDSNSFSESFFCHHTRTVSGPTKLHEYKLVGIISLNKFSGARS